MSAPTTLVLRPMNTEDGRNEYVKQRHVTGVTLFAQLSEHPDISEPLTPYVYVATGIPMESQGTLQGLFESNSMDISVGQKVQLNPGPGVIYAMTTSIAHSIAVSQSLHQSQGERYTAYLHIDFADVENTNWRGAHNIKHWKSGFPKPYTIERGSGIKVFNTDYDDVLLKGDPWTVGHYNAAKKQWSMTLSVIAQRSMWSMLRSDFRGPCRRQLRSSELMDDTDDDVPMTNTAEEKEDAPLTSTHSLTELKVKCAAIFDEKNKPMLSDKVLVRELAAKWNIAISRSRLVDALKMVAGSRNGNWSFVDMPGGGVSFKCTRRQNQPELTDI